MFISRSYDMGAMESSSCSCGYRLENVAFGKGIATLWFTALWKFMREPFLQGHEAVSYTPLKVSLVTEPRSGFPLSRLLRTL